MKNANDRRLLWAALALLWLAVIWSNSLQTAAESSERSLGILEFLTPLLTGMGIPEELQHTLIRKLAHMAEYGVLGLLWSQVWLPAEEMRWSGLLTAGLLCLTAAGMDETFQRVIPGRSGELRDVVIDFAGSAAGIGITMILQRLTRQNKRKEE